MDMYLMANSVLNFGGLSFRRCEATEMLLERRVENVAGGEKLLNAFG
jgi:hypothetical protein